MNVVAHVLCKWAAKDHVSGFCNFGEIPTPVRNRLLTFGSLSLFEVTGALSSASHLRGA